MHFFYPANEWPLLYRIWFQRIQTSGIRTFWFVVHVKQWICESRNTARIELWKLPVNTKIIFDNLKDVRPQGWGLTPPYLDYLESEDKSATSTNGANGDLKKLFPPSYFVRLVGRLTHSLQVHHKFFSRSIYCNLQVHVQGFTKRWTLGCEKFLPGPAWLLHT